MTETKSLTFARTRSEFAATLHRRVNEYFKQNNLKRHGNREMVLKTIFMFTLYFGPYALILSGIVASSWLLLSLVVVMGFGLAGIGLSVMHDANHGAYSDKSWVNSLMGYSINLIGANAFAWKIQHNVLHHTFTNVHDHDEDISPRGVLRLTPHTNWKYLHRFQFIYAWFLYGMMTIVWLGVKDFVRLIRYHRDGTAKKQKANIAREWAILIFSKLVYIGYIYFIPLLVTPLLWWQVLLGLFLMHYIAGFILAIIFQPAHVIEGTEFPLPDENNNLENNWAIHQLHTTTNFGNDSKWFSWYVGGLNFQIEHHLFPNICHVHYRNIAGIVRETTREFNLPYKSTRTFVGALIGRARLLRDLGRRPLAHR
jgi:linoleoyl-CoA desaturase